MDSYIITNITTIIYGNIRMYNTVISYNNIITYKNIWLNNVFSPILAELEINAFDDL